MTDPFSPQRIADRLEIEHVIRGFCQAVDRADFDVLDAVFHDDAVCNQGAFHGPARDLVPILRARHAGIVFAQHHITNIMIEFVVGDDRALVESYCLGWVAAAAPADALPRPEAARVDGFSTSRFIDIVERRDGRWKIAERTAIAEARTDIAAHPFPIVAGSAMVAGRRDKDDFLFRSRRKLGLG